MGENIIPLFAETSATSIYIPESKENSQIMPMVTEDVIDSLDKANVVSTDAILVMFTRHMVSLDGGALDKVSADLYTQQIKTILTSLKTDDFTSLFDQQIMKCSFLNTKINDSRYDSLLPSTRQKYLTTLLHFCNFVNQNESEFRDSRARFSIPATHCNPEHFNSNIVVRFGEKRVEICRRIYFT